MIRRGFTIIETIAAIVILAVALPPLFMAIRQATNDRAQPILMSRARWLASEKLEDVIADRYSSVRGYDYLQASNYPRENSVTTDPSFSRFLTFRETGPDLSSSGEGYMTVAVTILWPAPDGENETYTVSTVLTDFETVGSGGGSDVGRPWQRGQGGGRP